MTYFNKDYSQIWTAFQRGKLSMNKREAALEPMRQDLYVEQFPRKKIIRKTPDNSMSRAEMIAWSIRQGVKSRTGE